MKNSYLIDHWLLTLLIAPFTSQVIELIWGTNPHQVVGLLVVYPVTVFFSIVFSIPTFLIYLTCFYFLSKQDINTMMSKFILITITIFGIYITQTVVKGTMSQEIIIAYSVTAFFVGLALRL